MELNMLQCRKYPLSKKSCWKDSRQDCVQHSAHMHLDNLVDVIPCRIILNYNALQHSLRIERYYTCHNDANIYSSSCIS